MNKCSKFTVKVLHVAALAFLITSTSYAAQYKEVYKGMPCDTSSLMDGFYVGAQAGYNMYSIRTNFAFADPEGDTFAQNPTLSPKGWMGGVFAGYGRYFTNMFYLGGEAAFSGSAANVSYTLSTTTDSGAGGLETDTFNTKITANTTYGLAILPGIKINNYSLAYLRLGYNWSNLKAQESFTGDGTSASVSRSRTVGGFTYGLGAEMLVSQNWSVRGEYSYTSYNSFTTSIGTKVSPSDSRFLAGVVYHIA